MTADLYVESSALAASLIERDAEITRIVANARSITTSALTITETRRAILRGRMSGRLSERRGQVAMRELQAFEERATVVSISAEVLERAGQSFPLEPVRTLDAIHLATIELASGAAHETTILSRDDRVLRNAELLGYLTI